MIPHRPTCSIVGCTSRATATVSTHVNGILVGSAYACNLHRHAVRARIVTSYVEVRL